MNKPREERYRVRHMISRKYLHRVGGPAFDDVCLRFLNDDKDALVMPRHQAAWVANAMIALQGDCSIEIEPVAEVTNG